MVCMPCSLPARVAASSSPRGLAWLTAVAVLYVAADVSGLLFHAGWAWDNQGVLRIHGGRIRGGAADGQHGRVRHGHGTGEREQGRMYAAVVST